MAAPTLHLSVLRRDKSQGWLKVPPVRQALTSRPVVSVEKSR